MTTATAHKVEIVSLDVQNSFVPEYGEASSKVGNVVEIPEMWWGTDERIFNYLALVYFPHRVIDVKWKEV